MQFKTISAFSAILFLAPALASPLATESASLDGYSGYSDYSDLRGENSESNLVDGIFENIPSSILEVLVTAIPVSWYYDLMNPASQSSIISEASKGIYPDWYSALPTSVLAWASSAAADGDDFLFGSATATVSATDSASASATSVTNARASSATITTAPSKKTTAASKTGSAKASSEASSETASDAVSSSASVTPSTSLSTGGAAIATGSAAMSFAGAIGLLGLVVAL